jgi:Tol biopolymer transport system component
VQKLAGTGAGPRTQSAGTGPRLAFSSNVQGNYEIYTVQADGSGLARLTNNPGEDWFPAWSPDATQIAFGCMKGGNLELCLMNADGSNLRQLTRYGKAGSVLRPSWSPDGGRIAFALESNQGPTAIYITGAGGAASRIVDGRDPAWSPDGSRIAFMEMTGLGGLISVINADGSGQRRLTNNEGFAMYPAWSPDGSQIAYTTQDQGLFVVNSDGSGTRKVSDHSSWGLAWSPDGTRLAISDGGSLIVLNTDGSGAQTLLQGIQPSWSK